MIAIIINLLHNFIGTYHVFEEVIVDKNIAIEYLLS